MYNSNQKAKPVLEKILKGEKRGSKMASSADTLTAKELLEAQSIVFKDVLALIGSMSIKCAVELDIPGVIYECGKPIPMSELIAKLGIPASNSAALGRLMRVLVHKGYFGYDEESATYSLTNVSKILIKDGTASISPWLLGNLCTSAVTAKSFFSQFFRQDHEKQGYTSTYKLAYGEPFWSFIKNNPEIGTQFNEAMAGDSRLFVQAVVSECAHVFEGLKSLMDAGGGTGTTARLLADAFPHVKFTVLDQPHVVAAMPKSATVGGIGGNIFEHIPSANAVFMKMILHDWDDEKCVSILKLCKKAIPAREEGGKVIIIDIVMNANNENPTTFETQMYWDLLMLTVMNGKQREEHEWKKIFFDAGFTDYKITPLGVRSLIEVFP